MLKPLALHIINSHIPNMNITKKDLGKSQIELTVEITVEEFKPYLPRAVEKVSMEVI